MAADFSGRGMASPLEIGASGGIRESSGVEQIEQSIRIILGTQHGERVMRPTFGANLRSLAFAPGNAATANMARHLVEAALSEWEPRIDVVRIDVDTDRQRATLLITVRYRITGTPQARSLTFPFPLEQPS